MKKYVKIENDQIVALQLEPGEGFVEFECQNPHNGVYLVDGQLVESLGDPNIYTAEQIAQFELNDRKNWAREYLYSTDWYALRLAETGQAIPDDVLEKRAEARQTLSS